MPNNITEEVKDTGEELITPTNVEEKLDDETPEDEKETPTAPSAEEQPNDEETEDEPEGDAPAGEEPEGEDEEEIVDEPEKPVTQVVAEVEVKKPKAVLGETPREYALRQEATRVKRLLRDERSKKLFGGPQQQTISTSDLSEDEKKVLESFDPEQVKNQEQLFTLLAKKHGYVREAEFTKKQATAQLNETFDSWMNDNPEFSEDKDPDGLLWKTLERQYKDVLEFRPPPRNSQELTKILNGIKNDIFGITTTPKQTPGQIKAKQDKLKTASHGPASTTPARLSDRRKSTPANIELSKVARSGGLSGFTEEQIAELGL